VAFQIAPGVSGPFLAVNRNKRGLTLDLKRPEAVAVLARLAATADVLVENYRPGVARRLGIDYETLRQINPRLVYCSISGFGAESLYASRPAFDAVIQAMSGLMGARSADGIPLKAGPSIADLMGAAFGFAAVVAALEHRDRTGLGQFLDLSMQDISAWATQTLWNHAPARAPDFDTVSCKDGYVLVARDRPADAPGQDIADAGSLDRSEASARGWIGHFPRKIGNAHGWRSTAC
jgi:crotonobetainyl-CoA:carnitine CoA-transferase CaiB-like acyl-CoA transferase